MNENERRLFGAAGEPQEREGRAGSLEPESPGQTDARNEFSWYGGQVDEAVLRNIVRLKREQKL